MFYLVAVVSLLWTLPVRSAPVSLLFEGTTLQSDAPFTSGTPFSVELTYETSTPKSYPIGPDNSGSWYQNAVEDLVFNYNNGEYIGTTLSTDLMIYHGPTYSQPAVDEFWVTGIEGEGFPAINSMPFSRVNSAFGVQAPFGAAFDDSSLPTSLSSPPFVSTSFTLVWISYSTYQSVEFNGVLNSVETVPEPSTIGIAIAAFVLATVFWKRTPFFRV
jgi:hypothetical protein